MQSLAGSVRPSIVKMGRRFKITNIKKLTLESLKFQVLHTISVSSECVFKRSAITMGTGTIESTVAR